MTRNEEILAGLPAACPNQLATFQGQTGYWCQADPVFIAMPNYSAEPAAAIAQYRQRLAEAHIAVNYGDWCDGISRLKLQAELTAARSRAEAAEAEVAGLREELRATLAPIRSRHG